MQMRYELNFDEDKIIDIEAIGDKGVLDLKDCCKIMNEQQDTIFKLQEENEQLKKKLLRIEKTVSLIQKEINNYYNEVCSNE